MEIDPTRLVVSLTAYECEDSPTRRCIYDVEDTYRDECMVCGLPAERK